MARLDQLRGYYVRSPRWIQWTGGRLLSVMPPRLLYGRTFRRLQAEIERSQWDAAFVERRVREQLAILWSRALVTPFYAARSLQLEPPTPVDLAALPILEKEEVRRNGAAMLAVPKADMDEVTTGGTSSGDPLLFYLDKGRSVKEWAFLTHLWSRCGYRLGDRLAVLGYRGVTNLSGIASRPWAWEPGTRELRLSPFRMVAPVMDEYLAQLVRFRIAFIYGYPSAITILARHAGEAGWRPPASLKGILLMSESIRPFQREVIGEGFHGLPVLSGYGLSEKVAIAGELPGRPDEYEFEPLYGVTEVVDVEGRQLEAPGERGRVIGTGFISMGMPLIRYDTGDLATVVALPSRENCWRLRVRDLVSRYAQDYLVTREGGLVARVVLNLADRAVRELQLVQDEPGEVLLRVVPQPGVDRQALEAFARGIDEQTDGTIAVRLEVVDEIAPTARGKRVLVDQRLDLSRFGMPYA